MSSSVLVQSPRFAHGIYLQEISSVGALCSRYGELQRTTDTY